MEGLILVFLALLAGVVLYLVLSQRGYQRLDYSHLIQQEERERRTAARLKQAEALLAALKEYDHARRAELDRFISAAKQEIADEVTAARQSIVAGVLNSPSAYDQLLLAETGASVTQPSRSAGRPATTQVHNDTGQFGRFLRSPQQQRIAEMLECGFTPQEVSRDLGVSRTEIGLVSSLIFSEKTA